MRLLAQEINESMNQSKDLPESLVSAILERYGFALSFGEMRFYIYHNRKDGEKYIKIIFSVLPEGANRIVIKILYDDAEPQKVREIIEAQSRFSEFMRHNGIATPRRYTVDGRYCSEFMYNGLPCSVTAEDWSGEEVKEIDAGTAYQIGALMARMHMLSLENGCTIGCGTLFSAAYENDVDVYPRFCELCRDEHIEQTVVNRIRELHDVKLQQIRSVWDKLPKAAVQGDISINNLSRDENGLIVFDYNNAGDEVLISDLVLEGLLTAYEMDLPAGTPDSCRELLYPAFLNGYLSVRKLSREEADAARIVYTLYHALWFTRIVYNENSLEKMIEKEDYASANQLLRRMLDDLNETDDGRFGK